MACMSASVAGRAAAACATDSECEGVKASKGNGAWAQKSAPAKVAEVSK
jgi:hypothetical protein